MASSRFLRRKSINNNAAAEAATCMTCYITRLKNETNKQQLSVTHTPVLSMELTLNARQQ